MKKLALVSLAASLALLACDDSKSKSASFGPAAKGVLTDSAIAGVPYTTTSGKSGITTATGEYDYSVGDTVTFNVGGG